MSGGAAARQDSRHRALPGALGLTRVPRLWRHRARYGPAVRTFRGVTSTQAFDNKWLAWRRRHMGAFLDRHSSRSPRGPVGMPQVRKTHYAYPFTTGVFVANLTLGRRHRVAEKLQQWLTAHSTTSIQLVSSLLLFRNCPALLQGEDSWLPPYCRCGWSSHAGRTAWESDRLGPTVAHPASR